MKRAMAGQLVRHCDVSASLPGQPVLADITLEAGAAQVRAAISQGGFSLFDVRLDGAARLMRGGQTQEAGFWLARVVEGSAVLRTEAGLLPLRAGDLAHGRLGRRLMLSCQEHVRLEGAFFGHEASRVRLASLPLPAVPALLKPDGTGARLLAGLLRMAAESLPGLTVDAMRPLELALLEFLASEAAASAATARVLGGSVGKNAIALRAMQAVELRLPEADLTPRMIASSIGISLRYLQKLFEETGETPNQYIRQRRLKRAWQDLKDPLYAGQSIAEISLRWGFSDAAYFSRMFKDVYGISPSSHRAAGKRMADARRHSHYPAEGLRAAG
jgi:AraC-like DNA-binding protein